MIKKTCLLFPLAFGACCNHQTPQTPGQVPMEQVVNRLKTELKLFDSSQPAPFEKASACVGTNGLPIVAIVPTSAELVLKLTASNIDSFNAGLTIPAGAVLTVNPSYTGSYQTNGTNSLTLDLNIDHKLSIAEFQTEIDAASKRYDLYSKAREKYAKNHMLAAKFNGAAKYESDNLDGLYNRLSNAVSVPSLVPMPSTAPAANLLPSSKAPLPSELAGYSLASTLWRTRQALLEVDHSQTPCVKPTQLKVEIDFEVIDDQKGGLSLGFYIVSIGGSIEKKNDALQTLTVTFDMSGGSSWLLN